MNTQAGELGATQKKAMSEFFETLKQESERGKILLLAAKIDELLCQLLKTFFKPRRETKGDEDKLFRTMGPLGSFASRIETAYRVGLISKTTADCLDILRDIRNDCAHKMETFSYEKGFHSQKFEEFKKLSYKISGIEKYFELVEHLDTLENPASKEGTLITLTIIHIMLLQITFGHIKMIKDSFTNLEDPALWKSFVASLVAVIGRSRD